MRWTTSPNSPEVFLKGAAALTLARNVIGRDVILRAPKVLLHDHLDGGLRPQTVIELARDAGYDGLPTTDPEALAKVFTSGADRKGLELYLEGFAHTVAV